MLPETIDDPLELLRSDRARAAELGDPHAPFATLATVVAGQPGARVVTVRRTDPEAILVSANARSPKVRALEHEPRCELLFYWTSLQRQYRLSGGASFVSGQQEAQLYAAVPWRAKTWDHVYEQSAQSTPVASRAEVVERFRETLAGLQARFERPQDVPATVAAGYLAVRPDRVEVQALDLEERLHDRRVFERRSAGGWSQVVLVP